MVKRVVLVHGWDGGPDDAWKMWLRTQLEKKGWKVIAPQLPGGEEPKLEEWLAVLKQAIPDPDKHTYFVGHSLGCVAILQYLATLPLTTRIGGVVLVAGFLSSIGEPALEEFTAQPLALGELRGRIIKSLVIGSRDDSVVSFGKVLELQAGLGAELVIDEGKGHFSDSAELPSVLKALEKCYQQRSG